MLVMPRCARRVVPRVGDLEILCRLIAEQDRFCAYGHPCAMPIPEVVAEQHLPPTRGSTFVRLLAATVVTGFVALLSALAWLIAQAQYINDYCTTRTPQPITSPPEALGGRPAYMHGPMTVACEYDGFPTVYVTEPGPLLGALLMMAIVIAVAFGAYRWARPAAR